MITAAHSKGMALASAGAFCCLSMPHSVAKLSADGVSIVLPPEENNSDGMVSPVEDEYVRAIR